MVSDAQKRANKKYRQSRVKQFNLQFYPDDMDLYEWFKGQSDKGKLIKRLLRDEMEREKAD